MKKRKPQSGDNENHSKGRLRYGRNYEQYYEREDVPEYRNPHDSLYYNEDDYNRYREPEVRRRSPDRYREPEIYRKSPDHYREENLTWKASEKKRKKRKGCLFPFLKILLLLVVLAVLVFGLLRLVFGTMDHTALDEDSLTRMTGDPNIGDYQNIVLFGVDDQDNQIKDVGSRTDCIIVASIHKRTRKVKLMSIYRDTYVSIDGNYDKINAAYSLGGPETAIRTINRNLDLDVADYATVNFKALADTIDILGGVELTIKTEKELENLNDYIGNMNKINGGDSPKFDSVGTYTFDGNQAVAYSRIRYMEGGDHERASHQRLVVEAMLHKAKMQPWKLPMIVKTVLPQCKTSLSSGEMTMLASTLLLTSISDSQAYPFDSSDSRYNGIYYGFPKTVRSNAAKAHLYLFGTEDYQVSDELGKISDKVQYITDSYGF